MITFIFRKKNDSTSFTIKANLIDKRDELMTIMWVEGLRNTEFERIFPWNHGNEVSMTEMKQFASRYQSILDIYMYDGTQEIKLGEPTHIITAKAILGGTISGKIVVLLKGVKEGCLPTEIEVTFSTNQETKEIEGIEGYEYSWELKGDNLAWTSGSAPDSFVLKDDVSVSLGIDIIVAVIGVTLNKSATSIQKGKTETLVATVEPDEATNKKVTWDSSKKNVATVDDGGIVTALEVGQTIITVTTEDGSKTDTCAVTVTAASPAA